jgi:hypothetical protein
VLCDSCLDGRYPETAAALANPRKVVVTVSGGLIQDIEGIPPGVEIEVRDYDISEYRDPCPRCRTEVMREHDAAPDRFTISPTIEVAEAQNAATALCDHCKGSGHDPEEYGRDEDGDECSISTWGAS